MEYNQDYVDFLIVVYHQILVQIHPFFAKRIEIKKCKKNQILFIVLHLLYNDEQFHRQVYYTIELVD